MKFLSFFSSSSPSKLALVFAILFIVIFRMTNVSDKETSWDVLGYYLPLPATFIYEDPLMENRGWIEEINKEKDLTGTLYQISSNDEGEPIYFFLLGMAILYLPFFLIGHGGAYLFDYPPDGFSLPYQYAMVLGAIFYTIIGLVYLRKILLRFIPDKVSAIVIILIVFATNYACAFGYFDGNDTPWLFLLLLAILLPHYYQLLKHKSTHNITSIFNWLLPLSVI